MDESVGSRLRQLRNDRSVSLSQLSRLSGVGKGTISELENDRRGARLDTLFALTTALNAPLGALLSGHGTAGDQSIAGASVTAVFLGRWTVGTGLVEFYRATLAASRQRSHSHAVGVEETVTVVQGRVLVGPAGAERELGEGESLRYPGDVPHQFEALDDAAEIVLLMHYPDHTTSDEGSAHHD
ncbi:helix-turn-helix domain-containing protein [Curtobacterium sp. ISL-83]|uniref:helix-turn-helix domain-containing protein n=1 Tax=Curtobacterium sp. ISL-83 TaxID=2819145 RepID=UPI001BE7F005|nr:XRE family transcriptional regulator [Curtobacterium sp. ISL-83]MBT2504279.1 helix-turn-helix domain-containing protein [Curtobacterium sp. ISL-83]